MSAVGAAASSAQAAGLPSRKWAQTFSMVVWVGQSPGNGFSDTTFDTTDVVAE